MISVLCTSDIRVRDGFASALSLEKTDDTPLRSIYQRGKWVLIFFKGAFSQEDLEWIGTSYLPDRLYIPYLGTAIDVVHEVGDVIVPNVFLGYNPDIEKTDVTETNRDTLITSSEFLTHLDEQKDYYVEDFGLSVGGIVVDSTPQTISDELATKLMMVYEADIYITESVESSLQIARDESLPSIIIAGIIEGKKGKHQGLTASVDFTIRNMITAIRLLEDEA